MKVVVDPDLETADIDVSNNEWNAENKAIPNAFEKKKAEIKG